MLFKGNLNNIKKTDIRSGYSTFSVGNIVIEGVLPPYPEGTPVRAAARQNGTGVWHMYHIKLYCDSIQCCASFLKTFKGVGQESADLISNITGNDIFGYIERGQDLNRLYVPGTAKERISSMIHQIKMLLSFERLYYVMSPHGGVMSDLVPLFSKYGPKTLSVLHDNPYVYFFTGGNYAVSEHLAGEIKMPAYDRKRMHALVLEAMRISERCGNTRISFDRLVHECGYVEEKAGEGYKTDPLFIAEEIEKGGLYMTETSESTLYIYLKNDYKAETMIAENLFRLDASKKKIKKPHIPTYQIEKDLRVSYGDDQRKVLENLHESGVMVITGGPGTGKTTLLRGILKKLSDVFPEQRTALCAPTGCAARRMSDATGRKASTVHRLLNIRPYEKNLLDMPRDELPYDLIILDEASMLDAELFASFLTAVKNGAMLILMGDKDQLPSVAPGNVLADLIESRTVKTFTLSTVYRQKDGADITDNAGKIIKGNLPLKESRQFIIKRFDDEKTLRDEALRMEREFTDKDPGGSLRIFSPVRDRKFTCSTVRLNQMIKAEDKRDTAFTYGYFSYSIGERIMFIRNNYELGYYNGEEGVIRDFQEHGQRQLVLIDADDGLVQLTGKELSDIEPCYVITAHKSQGSECDYALVLVPKNPKSMLLRKILYVEVTRAKKQVIILSEGDALEQAVKSRKSLKRDTGLMKKIEKKFFI